MRKSVIIISILAMLLASCDDSPVFPLTPKIEFLSITPGRVPQDSINGLVVTIHFQDGDGDLGVLADDEPTPNLFVKDIRPELVDSNIIYEYTIPNLTPNTRKPSIQGTIDIIIDAPLLIKNMLPPFTGPSEEEVQFEIYLNDRAGNRSNTITTIPIVIFE